MCPAVSLEVGLHVAEHVKFGRHWKAYNFLVWNLAVTMLLSTEPEWMFSDVFWDFLKISHVFWGVLS